MLTRLEEKEEATQQFVVCDIEAYAFPHAREGDVLAIDTAWRMGREIVHQRHDSWSEWWSWLCALAEIDPKFRVIYAHNGGGYDWVSFLEFALHEGRHKRENISAACAGSKIVTMCVQVANDFSIHLCDSLQLLRSKLDKLAEIFVGKRKIEIGDKLPHELYAQDREKFLQYHVNDTEVLLEIMEKALELLRDNVAKIGEFGFTIGSTALKVFRTMGLPRDITIPVDEDLKDFLREGYRGGRVECFQPGNYEDIRVYDINSLYPYAMSIAKVPISDRGVWTRTLEKNCVGIFRVKFKQNNHNIFPVLMVNGTGVYEGSGVFFSPELLLFKEVDKKCEIEIEEGFEFLENEIIFDFYVQKLYALRLKFPDSPISLLSKYLLNSLYGKFGQHPERESIVSDGDINLDNLADFGDTGVRPINPRLGVFGVTKGVVCNFEHVGIAGMITSVARVQLYRGLLASNKNDVVYVDTDSIHTMGHLPSHIVGKELGAYKCEFEGEGSYAGKKLYALRSPEGKEKVRVKGVSVGGKFGEKISFKDIQAIVAGTPKLCRFRQFATPMEVFKESKKAGTLCQRKRTIRMMPSRVAKTSLRKKPKKLKKKV
jgi:hypothetical protein